MYSPSTNSTNLTDIFFKKLRTLKLLTLPIIGGMCFSTHATPIKKNYPNWEKCFDSKKVFSETLNIDCKALQATDNFITKNKAKDTVAVFDWDGTLYGEEAAIMWDGKLYTLASQPVFHVWSAINYFNSAYPFLGHTIDLRALNLYPHWQPTVKGQMLNDLVAQVMRLEGVYVDHKGDKISGHAKQTFEATLESGMTPANYIETLRVFLETYKPELYMFKPMFDIVKHMVKNEITPWIISGSNGYYITEILSYIEEKKNIIGTDYSLLNRQTSNEYGIYSKYGYNPSKIIPKIVPNNPEKNDLFHIDIQDRIVGNQANINYKGEFSRAFDDTFVPIWQKEFDVTKDGGTKKVSKTVYSAVMEEGKAITIRNIEKYDLAKSGTKKVVRFVSGNSGGDAYMLDEICGDNTARPKSRTEAMCLLVNDHGKLPNQKARTWNTYTVSMEPKMGAKEVPSSPTK